MLQLETIAALATPAGRGGIGIIRISGSRVPEIAPIVLKTLKKLPPPRQATFTEFVDKDGQLLDQGLVLYFPAPHSFTGEDVLELQGHGGMVVMDTLLKAILAFGARLARPGEFSERAFLNGKIDLAQAEAIADLIDSASTQAARCALRSLQGEFSTAIHSLVEKLLRLHSYIEAGIDFVEEEIDLLADGQVQQTLTDLLVYIDEILAKAQQGYLLKEGMRLAIVGAPNVGKSSLLNRLAGRDTAIVTPIAGTTRDIVREQITLDGMPLHLIDTAGLRETTDIVEQEGIRRTKLALQEVDAVLLVIDNRYASDAVPDTLLADMPILPLIVRNKIDLSGHEPGMHANGTLYLSANTGVGIETLKTYLKHKMGLHSSTEGIFLARRRHLTALQQARTALVASLHYTQSRQNELLAEELGQAQQALGEITGRVTTDDLLGRIFATFCIGK
ncbi:MAG: tRNA uridine-5-carboxymethylaminomethyl(34) synthesis GTPase MnmE [Beggiatoa sp. IS2]|nr:MAG: tRNA uridine-5-carboxymethylaminomethyl(34) synthesis GTPase MnmE [Beggiatoa sp. IS2]